MKDVLLVGIDTLKVGYHLSGSLSREDVEALKVAKAKAQERQFDAGGYPLLFHWRQFRLLPKGSRGYEWILQNDDINIQLANEFNGGQSFPEAMVTYRSSYLWRKGWRAAESDTRAWLKTFVTIVGEKVSRADLMVDVGAALPELDLTNGQIGGFCLRHDVHHIGEHAKGRSLTGYEFGAGDLMARLYDKVKEAKLKGKEWFFKLWKKNGWDGTSPVARMEFEWHREKLKEWQVNSIEDLAYQLRDLWKHSTETWLILRDKVDTDSNCRRWPISDFWQLVQAAGSEFGMVTGVTRLQQVKPGFYRSLRVARGFLASAIAVAETAGLGKGHGLKAVRQWFARELRSQEFQELVEEKEAKFATMESQSLE